MSRTVRRVGKALDPTREAYWIQEDTQEFLRRPGYQWGWIYYRREFLKGKEYRKGWWQFHADHHKWNGHRNNRMSWSSVRTENKEDLCKWFKDPDHEVFFVEDVNKRDWD